MGHQGIRNVNNSKRGEGAGLRGQQRGEDLWAGACWSEEEEAPPARIKYGEQGVNEVCGTDCSLS